MVCVTPTYGERSIVRVSAVKLSPKLNSADAPAYNGVAGTFISLPSFKAKSSTAPLRFHFTVASSDDTSPATANSVAPVFGDLMLIE